MAPVPDVERFLELLISRYPDRWSNATLRFALANVATIDGLELLLDEIEWQIAAIDGRTDLPTPPPSDVHLRRR